MTEQEAITVFEEILAIDYRDTIPKYYEAMELAVKDMKEVQKYREIGTPDECRAAVEKQKEMIAYCDENNCYDCPYHGGSQKENRCMNDFIAEKISKGVYNACIDAIGGGDN